MLVLVFVFGCVFQEPIIFSGHRLSKEDDSIWFRSAEMEDNGFYTCVLR